MRSGLAVTLIGTLCVGALLTAARPDSPVADAAHRGDRDALRALLQEGADVNAAHGDGMTALHWAAERSDGAMAEMLVYAGADVGAVTRIGHYTPLHVASRAGSAPVVDILLAAGADITAITTISGTTALHLAASAGNVDVVTVLLDRRADVNAREAAWGQTPLIFAASRNRVDVIRALLARGADPGITSEVLDLVTQGKLAEAAGDRRQEVLDAFDAEGQEALTPSQVQAAILAAREVYLSGEVPEDEDEEEQRPPFIDSKGGLTALLHAVRQGYIDAAMALLDGGADINQASAGDGSTPLLMATINGQYDLALRLIARGADPNVAATVNGATPLWSTINAQWQPRTRFPQPQEHGLQHATYLDVAEALLEAGADPAARLTRHPWYMVYTGCGNRNCGLADTDGSTAFWRAAYATDVDAMRLLVAYGADPNIPTKAPPQRRRRGATFGRQARPDPSDLRPVLSGGPGVWPATVTEAETDPSGLPPYEEGGPGVFPIHAASGVGYGEGFAGNAHRHAPDGWLPVVKYLIDLGADVNARDHNGYNALHHAAARGDNDMILYLVAQGCDVTAVSRRGQTTADMANGPVQRVSPFPETVALLESLGSKNNHNCVSC